MTPKIIMLASEGTTTRYMYHGLQDEFKIDHIIIDGPVDRWGFIKRRIKRLGLLTVIGQVIFQLFLVPIIRLFSKKRIQEIIEEQRLDGSTISANKMTYVNSVNSDACLQLIEALNPELIIVNGTRIISKRILNCTNAAFINTHVGITPRYRGVHGGYWALVNNDGANCGVTVHKVDTGIDTGGVIYQATINPTKKDNFATYTYLQIAEGIKIMKQAVRDFNSGTLREQASKTKNSRLWSHPTAWFYLWKLVVSGVG